MNLCESSDDDSPQSKLYTVKSKGKKKRNKKSSEVRIFFHQISSSLRDCDNTQGDMDEEEDLCAVPPHIMRIMQVQNMSKILIIVMVVMNNVVVLVMTNLKKFLF